MTDLRAVLIEAGAVALSKHHWPVRWDRPENIEACKVEARITLDAVLDMLADRADEARNQVYELWAAAPGEPGDMLTDLIAVLRGDTE